MNVSRLSAAVALLACLVAANAFAQEPSGKPPDLPGSSMWIPWSDFKEILDRLARTQIEPPLPPPPVDAVVSSADYLAVVGEGGVSLAITAQILVLKQSGWASVPLMRADVPISQASLDGKPTALTAESDGLLHLVTGDYGPHTLTLKLQLERLQDSGPEQFAFPAVRAQVNHLKVTIGEPDLLVRISPHGHVESRTVGSSTEASGSFPPADQVTVNWTRSVPKTAKETARVSAEVRTMLTVGEGLAVYTAIVDYEIKHKPVSRFSMILPAGVSVADVSTEGLADWEVQKTGDDQELIVTISFGAIGRHQVALTYEDILPSQDETTLKAANLVVKDVVHEVGYLAVAVSTTIQVDSKEGSFQNLAQVDPNDLPPDLRGSGDQKVLYGFKYVKHPSGLELAVVKHKDASVLTCEVEQAQYRIMLTDRGKELIEADFRIANRSLQYLTLTLPQGADLWGVYRDGEPIKAAEDNGKILLPVFKGGLHQTFDMRILAYRASGAFAPLGSKKIELPVLDVGANKVHLELYLPDRFRFFGFGGPLRPTQGQLPVSTSLTEGGKAAGDYLADEKGKRDYLYGSDKETVDRNLRYRIDQSQVQQQIAEIPVIAANEPYVNAMARGGLPVEFDIAWEGVPRSFATSIVDPGERVSVRFFYNLRSRSSLLWLAVVLLSAYVGHLVTRALAARRSELIARPSGAGLLAGAAALVLLFVGAVMLGSRSTPFWGFVLGAFIMLVQWFHARRKGRAQPDRPQASQEGGSR